MIRTRAPNSVAVSFERAKQGISTRVGVCHADPTRKQWMLHMNMTKRVVALVAVVSMVFLGGCFGDPAPMQPKSVVVIVKGEDPVEMMARAVELLGGLESIVGDAKTVVLKPNLTGLMGGEYKGVSTSGEVMGALLGEIRKCSDAKLTIAEGPGGGNINWIMRATNMEQPAKDYDVEVVNVLTAPRVKVDLPNGQAYKSYEYPQVAKEADVFINVPVMKTHQLSGITVGFKNLFGYFPGGPSGRDRGIYHDRYADALIDLATIRKPDLVVVDALVGMEGRGPLWGSLVKHNLIIVGTDMVAVDTVCGALMGQPIELIPYTNKAAKLGMGVADLKNIEIRGEKIEDVKKDYEQPRWYVGVQIPRTPELIEIIEKLADGKQEYIDNRDNTVSSVEYYFADKHLTPDTKKYPLRKNTGFTVTLYMKWNTDVIEFQTRYNLYHDDLREAAEVETRAWIKENLGDIKAEDIKTLPLGGDWRGRKE